jgi:hypothetical protein
VEELSKLPVVLPKCSFDSRQSPIGAVHRRGRRVKGMAAGDRRRRRIDVGRVVGVDRLALGRAEQRRLPVRLRAVIVGIRRACVASIRFARLPLAGGRHIDESASRVSFTAHRGAS